MAATSLNLAKRLVQAKEPISSYQEALKREELQVYHDSQHNEDERNLLDEKQNLLKEQQQDLQQRSDESEQSAHEATQMVDNSSCCLEDTYEHRSSQEVSQPIPSFEKLIPAEKVEEPVPIKQKVEQQEVIIVQETSPTKKRLSKNFLAGNSILDMLEARAAAIGAKKR